jgi:hypothetical protein
LQEIASSGDQSLRIPNHLLQSILVTLFCCVPLSIPTVVYAAQVNSKVQAGDIQGAIDSSNKAKMFAWISFGVGLVVGVIYGIMVAIRAATSS